MQLNDPLVARYFDEIAAMKITQTDDPTPPSGADAGDTVNELVHRNLRFVIRMAKRYRGMGLPFADLIGEGNLEQIGAHFSRSRERIRQVKRRAMSRLRTGSRGSHLRAYFTTD